MSVTDTYELLREAQGRIAEGHSGTAPHADGRCFWCAWLKRVDAALQHRGQQAQAEPAIVPPTSSATFADYIGPTSNAAQQAQDSEPARCPNGCVPPSACSECPPPQQEPVGRQPDAFRWKQPQDDEWSEWNDYSHIGKLKHIEPRIVYQFAYLPHQPPAPATTAAQKDLTVGRALPQHDASVSRSSRPPVPLTTEEKK